MQNKFLQTKKLPAFLARMKYILSVTSYSTVTVTVTAPSTVSQTIAFCIHLLTTKEDAMQSKLFHPKQTASHTGVSEAILERKRWGTFTPSPLDTLPMAAAKKFIAKDVFLAPHWEVSH